MVSAIHRERKRSFLLAKAVFGVESINLGKDP